MQTKTLITWVGHNDLETASRDEAGPVLSTLRTDSPDRVVLLCNYPKHRFDSYVAWLREQVTLELLPHAEPLSSPVHFGDIHAVVSRHLQQLADSGDDISILLSPGTPAMQAVWILLGKTHFNVRFYQSSPEKGVEEVDIPFEIAAEYVPAANALSNASLSRLAAASAPVDAAFDRIITQCSSMRILKRQASILAQKRIPVLIYGATGTGKELFARAIHNAGPRADKPFTPVNCGAISEDLIDSHLFGHRKGAFTGAVSDRDGVFQQAHGGTLFLDEFGELTPAVQVRLLRAMQEGTVVPVGASREERVDVRIIAATHRDLMAAVAEGKFREDLFYRMAVGVLHLPSLRDREGDLLLLADRLLSAMADDDPALSKVLSPQAKKLILQYSWPGNVREMQSTLLRAALWCGGSEITAADLRGAFFSVPQPEVTSGLPDVSAGLDIHQLVTEFVRPLLVEAMRCTGGNKTRAARLLGLNSQQTLTGWMRRYGVELDHIDNENY